MALRPTSSSTAPVRDVRAAEDKASMTRAMIAQLLAYLRGTVGTETGGLVFAEARVWLRQRDAFLVLVAVLTGLRRFEILGATCGDVLLDERRLWVTGKRNIRDFVPLSDEAHAVLTRWLAVKTSRGESVAADAPLFAANDGTFMSRSVLRDRWKRVLAAADLPGRYGFHATRHAAGLIVFAQTGSIEKTARFLRHRDTAVTARHYLHVDVDELRRNLSVSPPWLILEAHE